MYIFDHLKFLGDFFDTFGRKILWHTDMFVKKKFPRERLVKKKTNEIISPFFLTRKQVIKIFFLKKSVKI